MNGIQNRRAENIDKAFPGCMGRVVNLFDFGPGMTRNNKLLMDKPHQEDLVNKALDPTGYQLDNKPIKYDLKRYTSNKKSNGTPMKMLIAHEMLKETLPKQKSPGGVVAKLMGLDTLPGQQPNSIPERAQSKGSLQNTPTRPGMSPGYLQHERGMSPGYLQHESGMSPGYLQNESGFLEQMQCEAHPLQGQDEYKDVYEVRQQSPKPSSIKDKSPQRGSPDERLNETRMTLVRQKFIEAKRLATDEKLRQSKEFQDALEVLSSNKELFLKFLQEPNSLFSQHLYELQSIPQLPHTKRITVLRPSNTVENNKFLQPEKISRKHMQKQNQVLEANVWNKSKPKLGNHKTDNLIQPTRIVVLKPSPGNVNDIKVMASPSSPSSVHSKDFFEEMEDDDTQCSREVAKEITRKMRENLGRYPMEETMLSSVLSNGYVGDESSFNRSDNEYMGEGNLTDSEVMTPTSRHSWDYVNNRFASHCSSSFSRASYSPESSVCREAKKRLSERWAMMVSTGNIQEQRQLRRSSSTLGEMLALSETKNSTRSNEEGTVGISFLSSRSCGGEQELRDPTSSYLSNDNGKGEVREEDSPMNLLRSRSVPVSSTAYGARLNVEVSETEVSTLSIPKEVERSKGGKSSFRGKVSSLFFSRNKKVSKEKSVVSSSAGLHAGSEAHVGCEQPSPGRVSENISQCVTNYGPEENSLCTPERLSSKAASLASTCIEPKQATASLEGVLSVRKTSMPGSYGENHEQPSPLSVLEASFEDDNSIPLSYGSVSLDQQGPLVHHGSLKSNLIAKSPPIESLVRSLSWDDACSDTGTPGALKYPRVSSSQAEEEQEWLLFIQKLLSSLALDRDEHSDTLYPRWHSAESPLDPLLIDEYVSLKDDRLQGSEAKRRQRRSIKKLIFDCVNAAVVDTMMYVFNPNQYAKMSGNVGSLVTAEEVWMSVREWFTGDVKRVADESEGDFNSQVVEHVVKKEVVGKGWVELTRMEVDGIQKEIEGKVLEELVEEVLFDCCIEN